MKAVHDGVYGGLVRYGSGTMQCIRGGLYIQTPHGDTGAEGAFHGKSVWDMVGVHGCEGVPARLYVKSYKNKYGSLLTIPLHNLLLMRGDCVHAGDAMVDCRFHFHLFSNPVVTGEEESGRNKKRKVEEFFPVHLSLRTDYRDHPFGLPVELGADSEEGPWCCVPNEDSSDMEEVVRVHGDRMVVYRAPTKS